MTSRELPEARLTLKDKIGWFVTVVVVTATSAAIPSLIFMSNVDTRLTVVEDTRFTQADGVELESRLRSEILAQLTLLQIEQAKAEGRLETIRQQLDLITGLVQDVRSAQDDDKEPNR